MSDSKKRTIGVCVTRVQGELCRSFLGILQRLAEQKGYNICVFHSIYDFREEKEETGAARIFCHIPYEELCAVVLLHDSVYDDVVLEEIIRRAREVHIPVIMAKGHREGCFGIKGNSSEAFEELLESVVSANDVKDSFFIAGRKRSGSDSDVRLNVWKKVMTRHGICCDENQIGFGEYYEIPTQRLITEMVLSEKPLPRLFVCANDIMAFAVIRRLASYGIRVPEDILVTGFDGLESAKYCVPSLATCKEDLEALTRLLLHVVEDCQMRDDWEPTNYEYSYVPVLAKSAGFSDGNEVAPEIGSDIFSRFRMDEADEELSNKWLDLVIARPYKSGFEESLPHWIHNGRVIIHRMDDVLDKLEQRDVNDLPDEIHMFGYSKLGEVIDEIISPDLAIRRLVNQIPKGYTRFFSMISYGDITYGIVSELISSPENRCGHINRETWTINRGLMIAINGERQLRLSQRISDAKYRDALTGRHNLQGASLWFFSYANNPVVHEKQLSVGVYTFISYELCLEKYGLEFVEEALTYLANSLALANPDSVELARISNDSFLVINLLDANDQSGYRIDECVSFFYGILQAKSESGEDWDEMEISCGYHTAEPGWSGKLDDMIGYAQSALYLNRVAFERSNLLQSCKKDRAKVLDFQMKFIALMKGNFFHFHFQPIVDARNGEIVAYEGLMRTDEKIGLNPLEVLEVATVYNKLPSVEWACFDGILKRVKQEKGLGNRKIFINTIPGYFLSTKEQEMIREKYEDVLGNILVEITESMTIDRNELEAIRGLAGNGFETFIAIDDYGTGHSNIVNLLEYKPQIVKIDRYLVHDIQNDKNKQMFVKNLVEMAGENHMKVLAEGVETLEELQTVIEFGVDLIQGYYTARPSSEFLLQLPEQIRQAILAANRETS